MNVSVVCLLCSERWLSLGPSVSIQIKAFEYLHAVLFSVQYLQQKVVTFRQFFILTWVLMMRCSGAYLLLKYNA